MILVLGILNLLLVLWQLATGMRWIKVSYKVHRRSGFILLISALSHGFLALVA